MIKIALQITGWLLAHMPVILLRILSRALGHAGAVLLLRRRRLFLSNIDHAFPERPRAWKKMILHESACRVVETALLSLASPFFSDDRLRSLAEISPAVAQLFIEHAQQPKPLVLAPPHIAYWESLTWLGLFVPVPLPECGVIFRPLNNPAADAWIKASRERHGIRLLSRRDGLTEAFHILRRNAVVGVLFDQNAGNAGALCTLFGRVCATTELPGLLAQKFNARALAFYPRRLGFWKLRFEAGEISHDGTAAGVTIGLNRWLENALTSDDNLCASWLWGHNRWRHQHEPAKRLRLESKRDLLTADLTARNQTSLPRKTRIFVRLPNEPDRITATLPLLSAVRSSRPDAELTLIAKLQFLPLLKSWDIAEHLIALPRRGPGYFALFAKLRRRYPDLYLLFTDTLCGDIEAWLTRCNQRFGIVNPGQRRPLLTHTYTAPAATSNKPPFTSDHWKNFLLNFGLRTEPALAPNAASTGSS